MTFINEGVWDRVIRIVAGITLAYAAWMTWPASIMSHAGPVSFVLLVIATTVMVTGLVGWCPVYALFDVATNRKIGT